MKRTPDLEGQHTEMLDVLQQERLALLTGDIGAARHLLDRLHRLQQDHIAHEEAQLIPRLPPLARWPAKVYLAEHSKLGVMLGELRTALAPLPAQVSDASTRLTLIDAHMPFKHVLEHHFEREEKGLFVEVHG